jgi:hypothetical protein
MSKLKISIIDIVRWIAVLPITILILILYTTLFLDFSYWILGKLFNEDLVSHIIGLNNMILIPIIISLCSYFIPSKEKFKTTLISILLFASIQLLNIIDRFQHHWSINPYVGIAALTYLFCVFVIYRLENKKR